MSIYDESKSMPSLPKFSFGYEKLKFPLIAVIAVLVIAFLIVSFSSLFKPDPLLISFEESTFDLSQRNSLVMKIVVFNVLEKDVSDSVISIEPVDKDAITVFPNEVLIPTLGKGETRTYNEFNVRPLHENIASGNYEIKIKFVSAGQTFTKRTSIYIKNN